MKMGTQKRPFVLAQESDMKTEVKLVSPEMAKAWLEVNGINRRIKPSRVRAYAEDMKSGRWLVTHQGIAFDDDGVLLDGQHRLAALIEAGVGPVPMSVTTGMPRETFEVLDTHSSRSFADTYGLDRRASSCCMCLAGLFYGPSNDRRRGAKLIYDTFQSQVDAVAALNRHVRHFSSAGISAAAVFSIVDGKPMNYVLEAFDILASAKFGEMPPAMEAFARFKMVGSNTKKLGVAPQTEDFIRALAVFDPARRTNSRIQIKDAEVTVARFRKVFQHHLPNRGALG